MPIDDCPHDFTALAATVLPEVMSVLRKRMESPIQMAEFGEKGIGAKTLLRKHGHERDFAGCYVFLEDTKPIYVGISRTVFQRLLQHVKGTTHFDASLAYRIAVVEQEHRHTRSRRMENKEFRKLFNDAQSYLKKMTVAYVEIENSLVLYVFEAYCAMALDTHQWNTFRTH